MDILGFVIDGEYYAIDVRRAERFVRNIIITPLPAAPAPVAGITNIKGGIVTLFSLARILGRNHNEYAPHALIFKKDDDTGEQIGILIHQTDQLINLADEAVIPVQLSKQNDEFPRFIIGLAEVDDRLYRIIDIDELNAAVCEFV